ncbi:MAG: alpha/beta fold hydrolase [Chloroflexi bacterium]|nr:alpha/beta fold hydrolase [Chloroflexota bacterium]
MPSPTLRFPAGSLAEKVARGEPVEPVWPLKPTLPEPPPSNGGPQLFHAGDFILESGEVIRDMVVCYETWGQLNQWGTNAVLVCHGSSGTRLSHGTTIGPGKAYDPDRYFVIAMDSIGAGLSSSPASSGLRMGFPRYNIRDMVRAQCLALTRGLGITQLRCAAGPSMGAYMALEFAVTYPAFVKSAVCVVPSARCAPHLVAIHEAQRAAIMADAAWQGGDYTQPPVKGLRAGATVAFPWSFGEEWFLQYARPEWYETRLEWTRKNAEATDANNTIYQTIACDLHDVSAPYGGDLASALARCRMPVLVVPCATDQLIPPRNAQLMRRLLPSATYVEIPSYAGHAAGALEEEYVNHQIRTFLEPQE